MARNVGEVFVTVLANTKVFERQVKQAAKDAGDTLADDLDSSLSQSLGRRLQSISRSSAISSLADRIGRQTAVGVTTGIQRGLTDSDVLKSTEAQLKQIADEYGEAFDDVRDEFLTEWEKTYRKQIDAQRRSIEGLARQRQQAEEEVTRIAVREEQERADITGRIAAQSLRAQLNEQRRLTTDSLKEQAALERAIRDSTGDVILERQTEKALQDASATLTRVQVGLERDKTAALLEQNTLRKRLNAQIEREFKESVRAAKQLKQNLFFDIDTDERGGIGRFTRGLNTLRLSLRRAGTGGAFDTLTNILGGGVQLVRVFTRLGVTLTTFPAKALFNISQGIGDLAKSGLISTTGNLAKFGAALGRLAPIAAKVGAAAAPIAGFVGAFAGLAAVTKIAGVLSSALTSVLGIVTLFAQQIVYATASLAAFIPIVAALPPVVGAIAIGFRGVPSAIGKFNDALNATDPEEKAKALEEYNEALGNLAPNAEKAVRALEPLIERFKETQRVIQDEIFADLDKELEGLDDTFRIVERGLETTARSINGVFKSISAELQSPAFKTDLASVFTGLQPIIADLGDAVGDFFAGFTGLIDALLPSGQRLSGSIADAAESFKEFTQSAEGKNKIAEFMEKAQDAASTLWEILKTVGETIGLVFGAAEEEGQGFLEDVLGKAEEFKAWIEERVADGRLQAWFGDVRDIAAEVWGAIEQVLATIDRLDTPENRQAVQGILEGFQEFLGFIQDEFIPAMETIWDGLQPAIDVAEVVVAPIVTALGEIIEFINEPSWSGLGELLFNPFKVFLEKLAAIPAYIPILGQFGTGARAALGVIEDITDQTEQPLNGTWAQPLIDSLAGAVENGKLTTDQINELGEIRIDGGAVTESLQASLALLLAEGELTLAQFQQLTGEREVPQWANLYYDMIAQLEDQGAFTNEQLDLIAATRESGGDWLMVLEGFLRGTTDQGKLTAVELDKVAQTRAAGGDWLTEMNGYLNDTKTSAALTDQQLDLVSAIRDNGGDWLTAMDAYLNGVDSTGELTTEELDKVAETRNNGGDWLGQFERNLEGVKGESDTTRAALTDMAEKKYQPNINVTDNGTTAAVQGAINGLRGKTITVYARLQRTAALQAALGGSLAGDQGGLGAAGGMFMSATPMVIGEAGPEALIPLARPLSQVDPAVRGMAAILRGQAPAPGGNVTSKPGKTVNVTMNVTPTSADSEAVAASVVNRAVALARL